MSDVKTGWDSYWDQEENRNYWLEPDKSVVELVDSLDKTKIKDILDLGCGIGRHAFYLVEAGCNVTAVDSSPNALRVLRRQMTEEGTDIKAMEGDYSQDLFPGESFDMVLAFNVLYHGYYEQFKDAIRLIYKWLRPCGIFFFTCPTRRDDKYGSGELVAPHTYAPVNSIHPGDIHYFADESDIADFLSGFHEVSTTIDEHYFDNKGTRQFSSYWRIRAKKKPGY